MQTVASAVSIYPNSIRKLWGFLMFSRGNQKKYWPEVKTIGFTLKTFLKRNRLHDFSVNYVKFSKTATL